MVRVGVSCFALCLGLVVLASILDHAHMIVFGPCAGPSEVIIYGALILSATAGLVLTSIGIIVWLIRKMRAPRESH